MSPFSNVRALYRVNSAARDGEYQHVIPEQLKFECKLTEWIYTVVVVRLLGGGGGNPSEFRSSCCLGCGYLLQDCAGVVSGTGEHSQTRKLFLRLDGQR